MEDHISCPHQTERVAGEQNGMIIIHFFKYILGGWRKVTRVAIQGRQDSNQWVKSFSLSYGYDSVSFQDYTEEGVKKSK